MKAQHKYYFSSNTGGEGNGTKEKPFQTLKKLSALSLTPGDTVFFQGGKTISGSISMDHMNGSKRQPIVFTSYGNRRCKIDGGNKEAFVFDGSNYFKIENLELSGSGRKTGNTTDGLKLVECHHAGIKGIEVFGFQKSGLLLYNAEFIEVDGVYAHENGLAGITVEGTYQKRLSNRIHFINCRTDNNPGDPTNLANHSGNGLVVGNCKNVMIEYCTATNNGWDMPRIGNGPVGIWAWEADSITIQYCISYRNKTAKGAADGGGFDLDGGVTHSIIQYCLSYENWGTGYGIYQYYGAGKWSNNTIRYCISINDGNITDQATAMHIWNGWNGDSTFTYCYTYNNFFYNDRKYALSFNTLSQHKNYYFFNNIFISSDTSNIFHGIDSSTSDVFLGNVWMKKSGGFMQDGFTDLSKWSKATGYEIYQGKLMGIEPKKPIFHLPGEIEITNPYTLKTNPLLLSLCVDGLQYKGVDIRKLFQIDIGKTDFFGNPLSNAMAYQPGICSIKN